MTRAIEVEFAFDDKKVILKGPEDFVRAEIDRFAELARRGAATRRPSDLAGADSVEGARNEREFCLLKQPKGHVETATVLAFWLQENGVAEFTEGDIRRAYIRAGIRPPKVVGQALRDAKRDRDFVETGAKRGTYKLTPHGDRTVRFDLPGSRSEPTR